MLEIDQDFLIFSRVLFRDERDDGQTDWLKARILLPNPRREATDRICAIRACFCCSFREVLFSLCNEPVAVVVERNWVPFLSFFPP
jgi:hypothetical protein